MKKYIGMDIDNKKIICCVVEAGKKDRYMTIRPGIVAMRELLRQEKAAGGVYAFKRSSTVASDAASSQEHRDQGDAGQEQDTRVAQGRWIQSSLGQRQLVEEV